MHSKKRFLNKQIKCVFCNKTVDNPLYTKIMKEQREKLFNNNKPIQNILPKMNPADREVIISGICYSCQNKLFT